MKIYNFTRPNNMQKVSLFINPLLPQGFLVAIFNQNKVVDQINYKTRNFNSRSLLKILDRLLKAHKLSGHSIKNIFIINGPGSFVSIRIGLAVANTLAYFLNIPVVGISLQEYQNLKDISCLTKTKFIKREPRLALPFYGQKPNITMAKKMNFNF